MASKSQIKKRKLEQYDHKGKERVNNPPVGLVNPQTDKDAPKKNYKYDPHLDPQLEWAGKAEHTSFEVPTVSLHVHERIDPRTIIEAVKKKNGKDQQLSLFSFMEENPPLREAVEFYKHKHNWTNRLIAGDSLLIMNSLLEKEGMSGKVQMIYMDPPYGIKYGSNFQPFVNKRDVKDGKDEDLSSEPEMIKAFRDTWELGIHSYLTYMRDRLLLAKNLLHESGSVFVQISDENVHLIRNLMDEIFGVNNFISLIPFRKKTMPLGAKYLDSMNDYLIFYAKEKDKLKYHTLFSDYYPEGKSRWKYNDEKKEWYRLVSMRAPGYTLENDYEVKYNGKIYRLGKNQSWIVSKEKFNILLKNGRIELEGDTLSYKLLNSDFPYQKMTNFWTDTSGPTKREYVVETSTFVIQRCLLMTTDPGDLVLDPTCGSGTTAYVAEQWGRR
jgi:adenine-specific DNA-methyltransferase